MANSLSEYYRNQGQPFPSLRERGELYEKQGLGSAKSYAGTADQNAALLNKLSSRSQPAASQSPLSNLVSAATDLVRRALGMVESCFGSSNAGSSVQSCPFSFGAGDTAAAPGSGMDVAGAVQHLNTNAQPGSTGLCARYVRQAIEAGGVPLNAGTRPGSARDYGPYLLEHNCSQVSTTGYVPRAGDVAVIQPYQGGDQHGHITMYNGERWVSDFTQRDMWGGPGYRENQSEYQIYRP